MPAAIDCLAADADAWIAMDELTVRRLSRLAGWACLITIAVLSLLPSPVGVGSEFGAAELDHLVAYLVTAVFLALGHTRTRSRLVMCILLIGFGGFMELGQAAIPGRDGSTGDFLVNAIGVGMGLMTAVLFDRRVLSRARR